MGTISLRSRSRNEIYFQPLKVCIASTNAGLFYFMPLKFICQQETAELVLLTNDNLIDININDPNDNICKWVMLDINEAKLLIKELKKTIQIAENFNKKNK